MLMLKSTCKQIVDEHRKTIAGLYSELFKIDGVIGNRTAFDHLDTRTDKIDFAISEAAKVGPLEAEIKRLEAELANRPQSEPDEIATLEKELEDVKAAILLTQETQPIVTSQRHQKRRDLVSLNNKRTELEGKLQAARSKVTGTPDVAATASV